MESTTQQLPLNPPLLIASVSGCTSWDEWLEKTELLLKELGYKKYKQNLKNEDFAYWKKFEGYQVGLFFYDFREYQNQFLIKPFCTKVFEVSPCGTVGIAERVEPITSKAEFISIMLPLLTSR